MTSKESEKSILEDLKTQIEKLNKDIDKDFRQAEYLGAGPTASQIARMERRDELVRTYAYFMNK